jgi:hypothetical protein
MDDGQRAKSSGAAKAGWFVLRLFDPRVALTLTVGYFMSRLQREEK